MATGKIKKLGLEVCKYSIANQSIPSGGKLTVDVSSAVPDGKNIVAFCGVQIGAYALPYLGMIDQSKATYVETATPATKKVVIKDNGTTGWSGYAVTVTFVVE